MDQMHLIIFYSNDLIKLFDYLLRNKQTRKLTMASYNLNFCKHYFWKEPLAFEMQDPAYYIKVCTCLQLSAMRYHAFPIDDYKNRLTLLEFELEW